jgi:hypothetical protein
MLIVTGPELLPALPALVLLAVLLELLLVQAAAPKIRPATAATAIIGR